MAAGKATLLISCIDRPGIIARVAGHLFTLGCNIITSDQYSDDEDGHFFWRIYFESLRHPIDELNRELDTSMTSLMPWERLKWQLFDTAQRDRIVLMVSRLPHCMIDLLSRHHVGELDGDVVGVVSNHPDLESLVRPFEVPFKVIPVPKDGKDESEAALLKHLGELRADTVVLARYMQVLSGEFLRAMGEADRQHSPQLPARLRRPASAQASARPRRQTGRRDGALRNRGAGCRPDNRASDRADDPSRHRRRPCAQGQRSRSDGAGKSRPRPPEKAGAAPSQPYDSLRMNFRSGR